MMLKKNVLGFMKSKKIKKNKNDWFTVDKILKLWISILYKKINKLDFNLFNDDILQPQPYMHGLFSNFNQDKIVIK